MIGIRTVYKVAANVTFTSNVTLATVGLLSALAANQKVKLRCWIPITVGATGGVRFQIVLPAGATVISTTSIQNVVAASSAVAVQTSSVAVTNALANAGNDFIVIEAYIENGATAGNVDVQFAQNTSDAATLTVLKGGQMDFIIEN